MKSVMRYSPRESTMAADINGYYYASSDYDDLKRRLVEAEKIAARWNWFISQYWSLDAVQAWGGLDFDSPEKLESYIDNKLL